MKSKKNNSPSIELELSFLNKGYDSVIGIDEAGRGSWAGPMCIGAFKFNKDDLKLIVDVKDSKLLSFKKRESIFKSFNKDNFRFVFIPAKVIDEIGLTKAFKVGLSSLLQKFDLSRTKVIVDGNYKLDIGYDTTSIIDGDMLHYSISCASIVAKVSRDRLMEDIDKEFPEYNFLNNKGYGTRKHIEAIIEHGVCPFHRLSYKPVKKLNSMYEDYPKGE